VSLMCPRRTNTTPRNQADLIKNDFRSTMISKTRRVLTVLALAALPAATSMHHQSAAAEPDCSDGYPRLGCKIWKVTIKMSVPASITCETGSEWQCLTSPF